MDADDRPGPPEALRTAPGFLVRRLYQAYTAAWARHVDATLTGPQFAVLTAVASYPEVDQGSLASSVALDRSTMADVCKRLEDRGLIHRSAAPADGRRKLLTLTSHGVEVLTRLADRVREMEDELMRLPETRGPQDSDEDAERLVDHLDHLTSRWESVADGEGATT